MKVLTRSSFVLGMTCLMLAQMATSCSLSKGLFNDGKKQVAGPQVPKSTWVRVDGRRWRKQRLIGWADYRYETADRAKAVSVVEGMNTEGADRAFSPKEMVRMREAIFNRHIADVQLIHLQTLPVKFGEVEVYQQVCDDWSNPWRLVLYQNTSGDVTEVAFWLTDLSKDWDIGQTMNVMFDAGLLPAGWSSKG